MGVAAVDEYQGQGSVPVTGRNVRAANDGNHGFFESGQVKGSSEFLEGIERVEQMHKEHAERMKEPVSVPLGEITVKARAIREKTGEIVKVDKDAETALREVDESISTYRQLLECLKS